MDKEKFKKHLYSFLVNGYRILSIFIWKNEYFKKISNYIYNLPLVSNLRIMPWRPNILINSNDLKSIIHSSDKVIILSWNNNSWKSYVLKNLNLHYKSKSYYLASQRFFHLDRLNPAEITDEFYKMQYNNSVNNIILANQNIDSNILDFNAILVSLTKSQRDLLYEIVWSLIWENITEKYSNDWYDLSPKYLDINGYSSIWSSTWTRLLLIILWILLNNNYEYILLDEPELWLSPKIQNTLSKMFFNDDIRTKYFPHIKKIIISTHSHIFLNKNWLNSNYIVDKKIDLITISRINSIQDLHNLQFNLLWNSFESLFLPSLFVLVEWKTDEKFIKKILSTKFPWNNQVVINCTWDAWVRSNTELLRNMVWDFQTSPYKNRIFAIFDSVKLPNVESFLRSKWLSDDNIIVWKGNWIEYCYPESILKWIFKYKWTELFGDMKISWDIVELNWIKYSKDDLAEKVIENLNKDTLYWSEFTSKFLNKIN